MVNLYDVIISLILIVLFALWVNFEYLVKSILPNIKS